MAKLPNCEYDAVIVGSGPNGLSAAITLQKAGLSVLILEAKDSIGGGLRTKELTLPGFAHDVCSAVHPLAVASPFFQTLPLDQHGLEFIYPAFAAAHPLENGHTAVVDRSIEITAASLGEDREVYSKLLGRHAQNFPHLAADILGPLSIPAHPLKLASFGLHALQPAEIFGRRFKSRQARALWAGMAAHSMLPLNFAATSAIGIVLLSAAHGQGWPLARGGSQTIANALASYFVTMGGKIMLNTEVKKMSELPTCNAILFDTSPRQMTDIAGQEFSSFYKSRLQRYRYGMGVFKIDWALNSPIPFLAPEARMAGTVHIGNTAEEIALSELNSWQGRHSPKPFVLLSQPSVFDSSRAPAGAHTAWAYCHTPLGSTTDMTANIEAQIERFAPGFKSCILKRHTMNSAQMEQYNANYIGGDINGGAITISQLFARPVFQFSPYRTSRKGLYICSASTPPGGGVHGMCGYHAAARVLRDVFQLTPPPLAAVD